MAYDKRFDGRKFEEMRPIEAKVGVVKNAIGSASFRIGKTWAIAAVYGPRELYPRFLQNPKSGKLRCSYNMMPFSGCGSRIRPGQNRRAKEISKVTEDSLNPVMDLRDFPNTVVDVFVEIPQADAGTRCAGICAASMALADAGFGMKDLVCGVAIGTLNDGKVLVDINYDEEQLHDLGVADIACAILPNSGKVTLLQMDGEASPDMLKKALEAAKTASKEIYEVQKKALKEKFGGDEQ